MIFHPVLFFGQIWIFFMQCFFFAKYGLLLNAVFFGQLFLFAVLFLGHMWIIFHAVLFLGQIGIIFLCSFVFGQMWIIFHALFFWAMWIIFVCSVEPTASVNTIIPPSTPAPALMSYSLQCWFVFLYFSLFLCIFLCIDLCISVLFSVFIHIYIQSILMPSTPAPALTSYSLQCCLV